MIYGGVFLSYLIGCKFLFFGKSRLVYRIYDTELASHVSSPINNTCFCWMWNENFWVVKTQHKTGLTLNLPCLVSQTIINQEGFSFCLPGLVEFPHWKYHWGQVHFIYLDHYAIGDSMCCTFIHSCFCKDLKASGGPPIQILVNVVAMTWYKPCRRYFLGSGHALAKVHKSITTRRWWIWQTVFSYVFSGVSPTLFGCK